MPDRWDIYNETIGNIISEARSLTTTEIMSLRSQLNDLSNNKKRLKEKRFSAEERIRMMHPDGLRGQILIHLLKNTKWENNKPIKFTRYYIAQKFSRKPSEISRATKKLIQLGLISMHREFFREKRSFRNVYYITTTGVYAAKWLIKTKKGKVRKHG